MSTPRVVFDLTPFEVEDDAEERWLTDLQRHVRASDHVVRLGEVEDHDEDYLVSRDAYGRWWAGRYIGDVSYKGRRLSIRPRFGLEVISKWLEGALNIVVIPDSAERLEGESFIALLMAAIWSREVDRASRHGPPAFRRDHEHRGLYVRGRLDVRETVRLRTRGSGHVASVSRPRDLDNDVSRALVAAERVLAQAIGHRQWHTQRIKEVLPDLAAVVGARPRLPSEHDLRRIRYTPITLPFREVAALSLRIARHEGIGPSSDSGEAEGLLLDVAELWELFVLHCVREAAPRLHVEHGTHAAERTFLLTSDEGRGLGRLKPDILVSDDSAVVAVIDAKYKRLEDRWPERPAGVDRDDLYQLASYLSRYAPNGEAAGMLLYPLDPKQDEPSTAEAEGRWQTADDGDVWFKRVPLDPDIATETLASLLEPLSAQANA